LISVAMVGFTSCSKEKMESPLPFGLPGTTIFDMAIDNNSVLYFVTGEIDKSVPHYSLLSSFIPYKYYLSRKSGKTETLDDRYQYGGRLYFDKNNHLLTHDGKAIYRIDGRLRDKIFELPDEDQMPFQTILSFIVVDNDNNIWAGGSQTGLYEIDNHLNVTHYHVNNSELPTNNLSAIHVDNNNDLWIITERIGENHGILKISNDQWDFYSADHSDITFQMISCLVTDKNGHLWTGAGWNTENQSLMRFDGSHWETINPRENKEGVIAGSVYCLQSAGSRVYAASLQYTDTAFIYELLTFDGIKWSKENKIPKDGLIINMLVDNHRQTVWVATSNQGIFKIPF